MTQLAADGRVSSSLDERAQRRPGDPLVLAAVAEFDDRDLAPLDAVLDPVDSNAKMLGDICHLHESIVPARHAVSAARVRKRSAEDAT